MPRPSRAAIVPLLAAVVAAWLAAAPGKDARGDERGRKALPSARPDSVREFRLKDLDGKEHGLAEHRDAKAIVLAWTAAGCPVSKVYAPRLAAAAKAWAPRGVVFLGVSSDDGAPLDGLRAQSREAGTGYPVLRDGDGSLAQRVGATTSSAVAVLDAHRRVRYVGAVDDQYGVGGRREAPTKRWLEDALEAVLAAKAVEVERTDAPGCPITFRPAAAAAGRGAPTWSGDVAKVVHARCAGCHRPGEAAPFSLRTFDDVRSRAATIRAAVAEDRMPPWHATGERGTWANDRRLAPEEKAAILRWADAGAPEGDAKRAPAPPAVPAEDAWEMGTPDVVLSFPEPQDVPAEGVVPYRYVRVPTDFPEDRWVVASEVRPGAPGVVHHVLVASVAPGRQGVKGAFEPTQGFFAAMVPGGRVQTFPEGMAKRLKKGHELVFQMHYTPNGVATRDVTRIALRFRKGEPEREVRTVGVYNPTLRIPAGAPDWEVTAKVPVLFRARILAFMPHMHLRGSSFRYTVRGKDGEAKVVCDVPRYDFNWQTPVRLVKPLEVERGSWLEVRATFDNSERNPYNPDPKAEVRWGDQTWDEMMIGYVDFVIDP